MATAESMNLSSSLEDYLEVIFNLIQQTSYARARDIGKRLNVSKSSVTCALHTLAEKELIHYEPYDSIKLTASGEKIAADVIRRHEILKDFFENVLAVDSTEADEAACRMEHAVSEHVLGRLVDFAEFIERCPRAGSDWIGEFSNYCGGGKLGNCVRCVKTLAADFVNPDVKTSAGSEAVSLISLKAGEQAIIVKIGCSGGVKKRLYEMGAVPGAAVELVRFAPLGDPVEIRFTGGNITLVRSEADKITVRPE